MSDDPKGAIPPEDEQTPDAEASDTAGAESEAPATPEGEAVVDDSPGDAATGADDEEELSADAAAALAAAQAAVADALKGDLSGSDDEASAVESAQASVEATNDDIAAMVAEAQAGEAQPFAMPDFSPGSLASDSAEMQLLGDVNVDVRIELGRTRMLVEDVLRLGEGAVVELEKLAGDPVDVYVNGRHVARGEVLVLNESFCVRVNEVLEPVTIESKDE
jgi:flagellar motor switch protein FliN/FliY